MISTVSTPFLSQKTVAISFLAGRQHLFKILRIVRWMCVHPLLWLLFGFNIHKWNPGFITCYSYDVIEKFITIFVVSLKKSQSWSHSLHFVHIREHFWNPSCTKLVTAQPNSDNLIENCVKYVEIHMKALKFWSTIFHKFFIQHFEQDYSLQMADHFALSCENLFTHLWTFCAIVLQFHHSLHFGPKALRIIHNGFLQHSCFWHEERG
jgi:hypothetical protein